MKTNSPTPDHEKLKALLAKSFHSEQADDVPPLPDDLRERIREQYGRSAQAAIRPTSEQSQTFFAWLSRLIARPAVQGAAAALVLLAVAAVLLIPRGDDAIPEGLRGEETYSSVTILIHGFDEARAKSIAGAFDDESAVRIVSDPAAEISKDGRTIVLDGTDGEIEGYTGPAAEPIVRPLPESPAAIAAEVARMSSELKE